MLTEPLDNLVVPARVPGQAKRVWVRKHAGIQDDIRIFIPAGSEHLDEFGVRNLAPGPTAWVLTAPIVEGRVQVLKAERRQFDHFFLNLRSLLGHSLTWQRDASNAKACHKATGSCHRA